MQRLEVWQAASCGKCSLGANASMMRIVRHWTGIEVARALQARDSHSLRRGKGRCLAEGALLLPGLTKCVWSTCTERKLSRCGSADGGIAKGSKVYAGIPRNERSLWLRFEEGS